MPKTRLICRKLTSTSSNNKKLPAGSVLALRKKEGDGLQLDNIEADANFDVLSVMHKTNVRFSLSHAKDKAAADEDEGEKHYAPQHRRFLTFPKIRAPGSFTTREKADNRQRLDRAVSNSHKYQLEALGLVDRDAGENRLTNYKGLDGVVEDKIQLAILQGELDNLPNEGKPLSTYVNPFVDRTTDLAYSILRKQGVKPEWIELQSTQTSLNEGLRAEIRAAWAGEHIKACSTTTIDASSLDASSTVTLKEFSSNDRERIAAAVAAQLADQAALNHMVTDSYNLSVPTFTLTRGRISIEYEFSRLIKEERYVTLDEAQKALCEAMCVIEEHRHLRNRIYSERVLSSKGISTLSPQYQQHHKHSTTTWSGNASKSSTQKDQGAITAGNLVFNALMLPIDKVCTHLTKMMDRSFV